MLEEPVGAREDEGSAVLDKMPVTDALEHFEESRESVCDKLLLLLCTADADADALGVNVGGGQ